MLNRRSVIKIIGSAIAGASAVGGQASADTEQNESNYLETEVYVEGENLTYMRARSSKKDLLLRLDGEKGEAKFAEIDPALSINTLSPESTINSSLRDQMRSMTLDSTAVSVQSTAANSSLDKVRSIEPAIIVDEAKGIQTASSGTLFSRVDVTWDSYIGSCGSVYNNHSYLHVAFEVQTYDLDTIPTTVGWAVFCTALLHLVGKKVQIVKKIMQKLPSALAKKVTGAVPASLCGVLFGRTLNNAFSGSNGTVALWDIDNNGPLTSPKLAVGASNIYDPSPGYMRNNRKVNQYLGIHIAQLT